jgi:hypothetical protein
MTWEAPLVLMLIVILISAYSSIGIFTSTLSDNQIVALYLRIFVFLLFWFEGLSSLHRLFYIYFCFWNARPL